MATRKKKSAGKGQVVKIDFGHPDAQGGGGRVRLPEGDYAVKVVKVEFKESSNGNPMLIWDLKITDGKYEGKKLMTRTMLMTKSLWVLRNLFEAAGKKVPSKMMSINTNSLVGMEFGVTVMDEEYEGRVYSDVKDYVNLDVIASADDSDDDEDVDDEDVDDEYEDAEDEDEEDDDEEDDDLEEVDLDDL